MTFIFLLITLGLVGVLFYDHKKNPTTSAWSRVEAQANSNPAVSEFLKKVEPVSSKIKISPLLTVLIGVFLVLLVIGLIL